MGREEEERQEKGEKRKRGEKRPGEMRKEFYICYFGTRNLINTPALRSVATCASITVHMTQVISLSSAGHEGDRKNCPCYLSSYFKIYCT